MQIPNYIPNARVEKRLIPRPYKGFTDCIVQTYKYRGISRLFQGNLRICIRSFPNHALNFAVKNEVKRMFKQSYNDPYSKNFISGGIAGALSLCFMYSLDNARQRLARAKRGKTKHQFNNLMDVYRTTLITEGISGLYRGFVIACIHAIIYRGCYFGFYDTLKPILLGQNYNFFLSFMLGYGVTIVSDLIAYPIDTIRGRMLTQRIISPNYKSFIDCLFQIVKNEGISALFKGAGSSVIIRSIPGAGMLAGFDLFAKIYLNFEINSR